MFLLGWTWPSIHVASSAQFRVWIRNEHVKRRARSKPVHLCENGYSRNGVSIDMQGGTAAWQTDLTGQGIAGRPCERISPARFLAAHDRNQAELKWRETPAHALNFLKASGKIQSSLHLPIPDPKNLKTLCSEGVFASHKHDKVIDRQPRHLVVVHDSDVYTDPLWWALFHAKRRKAR